MLIIYISIFNSRESKLKMDENEWNDGNDIDAHDVRWRRFIRLGEESLYTTLCTYNELDVEVNVFLALQQLGTKLDWKQSNSILRIEPTRYLSSRDATWRFNKNASQHLTNFNFVIATRNF